ncbi:MAG: ABC transporter ATP-binding protein [Aggregatilineales bacterium]
MDNLLMRTHATAAAAPARNRHAAEMIAFDAVSFGYGGALLLERFSWIVREGEAWSVLGPSGAGKTTLLYLIAGLRRPQRGALRFRGQPLNGPSHDVGLMLQDYGLLPWLTVRRNVELGLKIRGVARPERQRIAADWLARMGVADAAPRFPAQLSGGQRQRVALARLLALDTPVLLLDEPLSAVDEITRERLQRTLWGIRAELGSTLVLVTHSVEEAALLTNNVLIFPDTPPLRDPLVLRRPSAADSPMPARDDRDFQRFCAEIRKALRL